MSLPFQIVSTDFDGTLYAEFDEPPVSIELQELIGKLQRQGVHWVINTGRDMSSLRECMDRSALSVQPDFLVLVEREIFVRSGSDFLPHQSWNQACTLAHHRLFRQVEPQLSRLMSRLHERFETTIYEDAFSPFCLIANDNSEADEIVALVESYCQDVPNLVVMRNDIYARLSHDGYTKGTALSEIARHLSVDRSRVLAAGDHWNDLPMLSTRHARYLIAPENAIEAVKARVRSEGGFISALPHGRGVREGIQHYLEATVDS